MGSFKEKNSEKNIAKFERLENTDTVFPNLEDVEEKGNSKSDVEIYHTVVDDDVVANAMHIFDKYRSGKQALDKTVVENEEWYRKRHQRILADKSALLVDEYERTPRPNSNWLFNALMGKHADAMDSFPSPVIKAREPSDENSAKILTEIMPCVLESSGFEDTYDYNWWEKLKNGTGIYGIFFDSTKNNGLGDIVVKPIDILNIFWKNGVRDIQDSPNVFTVSMVDAEVLKQMYPQKAEYLEPTSKTVNDYHNDDYVDDTDACMVIDWYYKRFENGRTILHYAKICNGKCLFATENDKEAYPNGWYEHGMYPFVFDTLYPVKNSCAGEGIISVGKDAQTYIDALGGAILQHTILSSKPKYFMSDTCGVNPVDLIDPNKSIVPVVGSIDDTKVREVGMYKLDPNCRIFLEMKINELKETTSNRDANMGGGGASSSGVALSAMQEAGNKTSRDMISSSYRDYNKIIIQIIELMRQFYTEERTYRIIGDNNEDRYVSFSADMIGNQPSKLLNEEVFRKPIFDIKISAQKKNPYTTLSYNQLARDLYGLGFFNPELADQTSVALELMDFEGKDKIQSRVAQNGGLMNMVQQLQAQLQQTQMALLKVTGNDPNMAVQEPKGAVNEKKYKPQYNAELENMNNAKAMANGVPTLKG